MADGVKQVYIGRDAKGNTANVSLYLDSTDTATNVRTNGLHLELDIAALSNCSYLGRGPYTDVAAPVTYGTAATYASVEDKAVFAFADAAGSIHRYAIPAPKAALFQADGETVDSTVTVCKQFIADMLLATFGGTAPTTGSTKATVNRAGQALTSFIGGYRQRKKMKRRISIFTLDPAETGPAE